MERKQQNSVSTGLSVYKISERHIYIPEVLRLPIKHDIALVRIPIATYDMQNPLAALYNHDSFDEHILCYLMSLFLLYKL